MNLSINLTPNRFPFLLLILSAVFITGILACGGSDETKSSTTPAASGSSDTAAASPTVSTGLPANFPRYPGAEVKDQATDPNQLVVTLNTTDALDKAANYYNDELAKKPWLNGGRTDLPEQKAVIISFANLDHPEVRGSVQMFRDTQDKFTVINVIYTTSGGGVSPS